MGIGNSHFIEKQNIKKKMKVNHARFAILTAKEWKK